MSYLQMLSGLVIISLKERWILSFAFSCRQKINSLFFNWSLIEEVYVVFLLFRFQFTLTDWDPVEDLHT